MSFSSGTFTRSVSDYVTGAVISSTDMNSEMDDIATALSTSLLKDGTQAATALIPFASGISSDTISEFSSGVGVTIDGVLLKDNIVTVGTGGSVVTDTIAEKTAAAGVTIDSVLLKDGGGTFTATVSLGTSTAVDIQLHDGSGYNTMIDASAHRLYLNDTANANADSGANITLKDAADGHTVSIKSSAVAHAMTNIAETDTYGFQNRVSNTEGGMKFVGLSEGEEALRLDGYATGEITTDTTSSTAAVEIRGAKDDGANGLTTIGATGNIFGVSNNGTTALLVKGNGDLHSSDADSTLAALDTYDDAAMIRLKELQRGRGVVRTAHDDFVQAIGKERLIEVGLLGADDPETGAPGLWNVSQNMRFLNGATWQGYLRDACLLRVVERIADEVGLDAHLMMAREMAALNLPDNLTELN